MGSSEKQFAFRLPVLWIILFSLGCTTKQQQHGLFTSLPSTATGIHFTNVVNETDSTRSFINEFGYMGGGVGIGDFNNDGLKDIYFTGNQVSSALYINKGDNRFEDITAKAGCGTSGWATGVSVVDINNDGYDDIYVCVFGKNLLQRAANLLFINQHDLTFKEAAAEYGLADTSYSTQAVFFDYDKDGDLDMYLANYLLSNGNANTIYPRDNTGRSLANDRLYRNDGFSSSPNGGGRDGGRHPVFTDVSMAANIKEDGYGLGVVVSDLNNDNWPDLYVANDFLSNDELWLNNHNGTFTNCIAQSMQHQSYSSMGADAADVNNDGWLDLVVVNDSTPKQLYINKHDGTFEEVGYQSGLALNENGREQAGMGLGVGDYDNDGRLDFHITNFSDDSNTLYRNDGDENFTDVSFQVGIGEPTIPFLGWGTAFIDYDNDGWSDLIVGNGHLYPLVDNFQWGTSFAQQILLFKNVRTPSGQVKFSRVPAAPASGLSEAICARGLALADFDNDGKVDAVINNMDMPPTLLKNVDPDRNNWISVKLVGDTSAKSPKDAVGSTVYLTSGKVRERMDLFSGASYASQSQQALHFGLGNLTSADRLEVRWPNGQTETFPVSAVNSIVSLKQGTGSKP